LSCSKTGKLFSDKHKESLSKNHADVRGDKNPFKGKRHSKDSIDSMIETRNKHPTWKKNATAAMKKIRYKYWTSVGKNPMDNPKSVRKLRLKRIDELISKHGISPNYNPSSISIIEAKAKELDIVDLQHAENGGEFYIKELGYWVDGYSKEKNIVIEYYESFHTNRIEKDKIRQNEITTHLGCEFIIIYENQKN